MKAIIPAAGMGTRLRPHTLTAPKVMIDVAGKPILAHIVDALIAAGVDECDIIVGYQKEMIIDYFTKRYSIPMRFPTQKKMLGLGHAVLFGLEPIDEPALIILGDTIIESDFGAFLQSGENLLGVAEVTDPQRFGIVEIDENFRIIGMEEKPKIPKSNLAISGIYMIQSQKKLREAINELMQKDIRTRNEYQLTDALSLMMQQGEIFRAKTIDNWHDCGKKETLLTTNAYLLGESKIIQGEVKNSVLIPPVFVGQNATVENCVLGPNVTIAEYAKIKDSRLFHTIVDDYAQVENMVAANTIIGSNATVKGSVKSLNISDFSDVELG
jgi:glucose-1-phosphate thymidylyltransferase